MTSLLAASLPVAIAAVAAARAASVPGQIVSAVAVLLGAVYIAALWLH